MKQKPENIECGQVDQFKHIWILLQGGNAGVQGNVLCFSSSLSPLYLWKVCWLVIISSIPLNHCSQSICGLCKVHYWLIIAALLIFTMMILYQIVNVEFLHTLLWIVHRAANRGQKRRRRPKLVWQRKEKCCRISVDKEKESLVLGLLWLGPCGQRGKVSCNKVSKKRN